MSLDFMELIERYAMVRFNVNGDDIFIYKADLIEEHNGIYEAIYALCSGLSE